MALVKGINRLVSLGEETTFGTPASTAQLMRRTNAVLQLTKDPYQSQEILPSQQVRDLRMGVRRVNGSIDGELTPGTYAKFFEGMLRAPFTAGVSTNATVTVTAGPPGVFTRTSGSFILDGFKTGDVITCSGFTGGAAANNSRNFRILDMNDLTIGVSGVGNETLVSASNAAVSIAVVGKKTLMPQSGQLSKSYTIESWYPDADTPFGETFTGVRVAQISLNLPASGLLGFSAQLVGQNMASSTTRTFNSPSAATTSNGLAAVNGTVNFNGVDIATITQAQISIAASLEQNPVLGSNFIPEIFLGRLTAQGSMSIYVHDQSVYNIFDQETEIDLRFYLTADGTINSPFISIVMNRVKLMSASKNDSDRSIIQQCSFQALECVAGGPGTKYDATTISVQDSAA